MIENIGTDTINARFYDKKANLLDSIDIISNR